MCDWNWELILEYVKALAWPVLVGAVVLLFRSQIAKRIEALREVEGLGVRAKMDGEVKELGEKVGAAADRVETQQPPEPEPPSEDPGPPSDSEPPKQPRSPSGSSPVEPEPYSKGQIGAVEAEERRLDAEKSRLREREERALALLSAAEQLSDPPDFDSALEVATSSPNAAVIVAFMELERLARAAWTVRTLEPMNPRHSTRMIIRELTTDLDREFPGLASELVDVRNRVAHGVGELSPDGALSYIESCDRLADVIGSTALSQLRHPSRSHALREAFDALGLLDQETPARAEE